MNLFLPWVSLRLDLGTGSGCIAITALLDAAVARASAVAIDVAPEALRTAAANGRRLLPEGKTLEAAVGRVLGRL